MSREKDTWDDGTSMVEFGLPIKGGRPVRIAGLFRPFAFRGACRSYAEFRRPALFSPIHSIDFDTRVHEIYGMYGVNGNLWCRNSAALRVPPLQYIGSSRRSLSPGATVNTPAVRVTGQRNK